MIYQLIFYVTSRCNLICRGCFFRSDLNQGLDWTLEEISRITSNCSNLKSILLTGGEPFIRSDLIDVLDMISDHQPSVALNINSNGTFPDRIEKTVVTYLKKHRRPLGVSISLDGKREVHNLMRGRGIYHLTIDSLNSLSKIKSRHPELYLAVNSLLTPRTIDQMPELIAMVCDNFQLDFHNVELVRGNGQREKRIPAEKLRAFYKDYLKVIKAFYPASYEISRARFELQYNYYVNREPWGYPCHAGTGSVVVYPDGELSVCEMRKPILNLKDFSYNLSDALQSSLVQDEVSIIRSTGCACTHGCWLLTSMLEYLDREYRCRQFERIPDHGKDRNFAEIE